MQYRTLGKEKNDVSILGFGCMRFPTDDDGLIDKIPSEKMLLKAVEGGVNYLDTAYPYHNQESELFVGEFIKKHDLRDKLYIATKLPVWLIKTRYDMDKYILEQLNNLQTEVIDYFLLHALNEERWENLKANGVIEFMEHLQKIGTVKNMGFSFHGEYETFEKIINEYDGFSFCQIQLNYIDTEYQAGLKGMQYAQDHGLDVIVMEPVKGGNLAKSVPDKVMAIWDQGDVKRTPARWAFDYVWQFSAVKTVLSGMSTMDQVVENLDSADRHNSQLTKNDKQLIESVATFYRDNTKVDCTGCNYCMPCPFGVNIPRVFEIYNNGARYENMEGHKWQYTAMKERNAQSCTQCGVCIDKCPQFIPIPDKLEEASKAFK